MTNSNMTLADLRSIALAAGYDLDAHGTKLAFGRLLGCNPQAVQVAVREGVVSKALANAALNFAASLKDGSFTMPTSAPRAIDATLLPADPEDDMSDEELTSQINKRFEAMRRFVRHAMAGKFPSVVITGPGGIGKTYPVEAMLRDHEDAGHVVRTVSGAISAVGLVEALFECRAKGSVLLLDDADGALANPDFVNVLKAATDSKSRRQISWLKQNKALAEAGVETTFEFEGSVIIISNVNMKDKAEKSGHIDAILSRAMHIDLGVNSKRALALRVAHMIEVEEMFAQMFAMAGCADLHEQAKGEIGSFIKQNRDSFRSLTLREAAKIARMYLAEEGGFEWSEMALLSIGQY